MHTSSHTGVPRWPRDSNLYGPDEVDYQIKDILRRFGMSVARPHMYGPSFAERRAMSDVPFVYETVADARQLANPLEHVYFVINEDDSYSIWATTFYSGTDIEAARVVQGRWVPTVYLPSLRRYPHGWDRCAGWVAWAQALVLHGNGNDDVLPRRIAWMLTGQCPHPGPGPLAVERPVRQDYRTRGEYESGQTKCLYDGSFRKPVHTSKKVQLETHVLWFCPLCLVVMGAPDGTGMSMHPKCAGNGGKSPVTGDFTSAAAGAATEGKGTVCAPMPEPTTGPATPQVASAQAGGIPAPGVPGPALPTNPPSVVPPEKKEKKTETLLDGRRISEEEAQDFAESIGYGAEVTLETLKVAYTEERRLVTHRNVQETKQGFVMQRITCTSQTVGWWNLLYLVMLPLWWFGYVRFGMVLGVVASLLKNYFSTSKSSVIKMTVLLAVLKYTVGLPSGMSLAMTLTGLMASIWPKYFGIFYTAERRTVIFCPHMVSCAMTEYENGVDAAVVRSNTRQKLLRLATLPIPDSMSVALMAGSEQIIYHLCQGESFFVEGVTYDASPL